MDLIRWYLQFIQLVIVFADQTKTVVHLVTKEVGGEELKFECSTTENHEEIAMHFAYSMTLADKKKFYFQDCNTMSLNISWFKSCSEDKSKGKHVTFSLYKEKLPDGYYYCSYRGSFSSSYKHENSKVPTNSTLRPTTPIVISKVKPFLRIEAIYSIIGLFILSIVVNVAFIIRCCIIRSYLNGRYRRVNKRIINPPAWSWVTCLCLREEIQATDIYYKTKDDIYEKIQNHLNSDASKRNSSVPTDYIKRPISQDTEKFCLSSNASQISRSSTFPARQSIIVHTPTDQISLSAIPASVIDGYPFMIPYKIDPVSKTMVPLINPNHRLSSHCIYDEVPGENIMINPSSTMPIRHFASTGSLNSRSRQNLNSNIKVIPLPEESQISFSKNTKDPSIPDEDMGILMNDCSSVLQDFSSSEETYLSGKDSDSMKDPVRVAKLEMSREMMAKADTLLREAHNLLKMT